MSDIFEKHTLSDGRPTWIQRIKIPGVRKPTWSVVICGLGFDAPECFDDLTKDQAYEKLADILQADFMDTLTV